MKPVALNLSGVHRVFPGGLEAVAGVDLAVSAGRMLALVGPSGCGKTTLLRLAGGLDQPTGGSIDRQPPGEPLGFCFQEPRLLPWRSLLENVELPLELQGVAPAARRVAAHQAIELVGLGDAADRLPRELSGGMRMRAGMARALVAGPGLLLLDEPFGALDEVTRAELDEELDRLRRHEGMTVLLITHSIQEAVFLADEVVVLTPRPARVVERFQVTFPQRTSALRSTPDFALLVARVHGALRRGMEAAA